MKKKQTVAQKRASKRNLRKWEAKQASFWILVGGLIACLVFLICRLIEKW